MAGGIVKCEEMQSKYMTNLKRLFCFFVIFLPVCTVSVSAHTFVLASICWVASFFDNSFVASLQTCCLHHRTMLLDIHVQYSSMNMTEFFCCVVNRKRSSLLTM